VEDRHPRRCSWSTGQVLGKTLKSLLIQYHRARVPTLQHQQNALHHRHYYQLPTTSNLLRSAADPRWMMYPNTLPRISITTMVSSQLMAETAQSPHEDVWLRRRSSAAIVEAELDYAMNMQAEMLEVSGLPDLTHINNNVDPAWISTCPLMSQSDVGKGQLFNSIAISGIIERYEEPNVVGTGKEHYHLRELTNQGLFGRRGFPRSRPCKLTIRSQ